MINHSIEFQASSWPLMAGEALSMKIGPGPRVLGVTEGRVWLTTTGDRTHQDQWLEAGQSRELAAGTHVVMEAWPSASFQLLVPPNACGVGRRLTAQSVVRPLHRLIASLQPTLQHAS